MKIKKVLALLMAIVMLLSLAACGGSAPAPAATEAPAAEAPAATEAPATEAPATPDPITLKLSMSTAETEIHGKAMYTFADYVHEKCPWITIEIYPSGTLYAGTDLLEAMMRGNCEMGQTSVNNLSAYSPMLGVMTAGFLFKDYEHMTNVMNGELGRDYIWPKVAEETGIVVLGAVYNSVRTVGLNVDKKIESRADLDGLMLRMPNSEAWLTMGEALGCSPVGMALGEVYLAIQTGAVNGEDNPLAAKKNYALNEVFESITLTRHIVDSIQIAITQEMWDSFDDATKAVFYEAMEVMREEVDTQNLNNEADLVAFMESEGVKVYDIDNSALAAEVWQWYEDNGHTASWDMDLYQKIQDAK